MITDRYDETHEVNPTVERILLVLMLILFAAHVGLHAYQVVADVPPVDRIPWAILTPIFAGVALIHGIYMLGWARALTFLGLVVVISFAFEYVGATTGVIFGAYHYTEVFGPKLFDTVPVVVPLAYFMVMYPSSVMASLVITGKPDPARLPFAWLLIAAFLGAMVMSAWDLSLDPLMSGEVNAWIWDDGGQYFGVPFRNFSGWVLTNFVIGVAYRLAEYRIPLKPEGRITRTIILIPIIGYIVLWVGDFWIGFPLDTRLLGPFAMGIPALFAILRLYEPSGEAVTHIHKRQQQLS